MQPYQGTAGERAALAIFIVLLLSALVLGPMLARRNLHVGRGDRRGAFRLAIFVFAASTVAWLFGAHHVPNIQELGLFSEFLVRGLGWSCLFWVLYIALEPYVRRRWPATLVSWSRLLAGGFRDPLVGRDVLAGCLLAAFASALYGLRWFVPSWLGHLPPQPLSGPDWQFLGTRTFIADISGSLIDAPFRSLLFLFALFLLRALLRKEWVAAVLFVLLLTILGAGGNHAPVVLITGLILNGMLAFLLIRFGLLAIVASFLFQDFSMRLPLTTQMSSWYAGISLAGILLMAAITFYAFYTSLGGRPVFGGAVLEE
jgi:serine/threonine-protein kinase